MPLRLVALDDGPDIPVEREMLVIGRHPQCDARLDSIRVSRRHCCMVLDDGDVLVRDLGSTNGIRINGQRVEKGRLHVGDELSIAHIRFRLDDSRSAELTLADPHSLAAPGPGGPAPFRISAAASGSGGPGSALLERPRSAAVGYDPASGSWPPAENLLAAAVRDLLPRDVAGQCRIQVIVQMSEPPAPGAHLAPASEPESTPGARPILRPEPDSGTSASDSEPHPGPGPAVAAPASAENPSCPPDSSR